MTFTDTDVQNIRRAFSRGAQDYQAYSAVQTKSAYQLIELFSQYSKKDMSGQTIADIGCGPAPLAHLLADKHGLLTAKRYLCLDLSHTMLRMAVDQSAKLEHSAIQADFHALPLKQNSCDIVVSNFALQWCFDWQLFVRDLMLVSKDKAIIAFALPLEKSFRTLNAQLNDFGLPMLNTLPSQESIIESFFEQKEFTMLDSRTFSVVRHFDSISAALHSIKKIGAGTRTSHGKQTIADYAAWKQLFKSTKSKKIFLNYECAAFVFQCRKDA